ncbi:MAG: Hsp20/alpha crystallin family protein [Clostridia bacterium]|nr:Hsp20/alpha crystallin family protein [Clostridia bacterium]
MFDMIPFMTCRPARRDPFREMEALERSFFGPWFSGEAAVPFRTDIREKDDAFILEAELPGFKKEEIDVSLEGETLTIKAEHTAEQEEKKEDSYIRRERSYGSYVRRFDVTGVDTDALRAKFEDGVLQLTLPKSVPVKPEPRKLSIE